MLAMMLTWVYRLLNYSVPTLDLVTALPFGFIFVKYPLLSGWQNGKH